MLFFIVLGSMCLIHFCIPEIVSLVIFLGIQIESGPAFLSAGEKYRFAVSSLCVTQQQKLGRL